MSLLLLLFQRGGCGQSPRILVLTEICDNKNRLAAYEYYPDGNLKTFANGDFMHTGYEYDADKNISRLHIGMDKGMSWDSPLSPETPKLFTDSHTSQIVKNEYTYDHNGNRLTKKQLGGDTTFHYNALNQLSKAEYPTYSEELFYDKAGNRTRRLSKGIEELYEYDKRNRLTNISIQAFGEQQEKNLEKQIHFEYDRQGNLLKDNKKTYTYDTFNRLKEVTTLDGKVQKNFYDAEGLRHEMEENGKLIQFLFNENKEVVAESTVLKDII